MDIRQMYHLSNVLDLFLPTFVVYYLLLQGVAHKL